MESAPGKYTRPCIRSCSLQGACYFCQHRYFVIYKHVWYRRGRLHEPRLSQTPAVSEREKERKRDRQRGRERAREREALLKKNVHTLFSRTSSLHNFPPLPARPLCAASGICSKPLSKERERESARARARARKRECTEREDARKSGACAFRH